MLKDLFLRRSEFGIYGKERETDFPAEENSLSKNTVMVICKAGKVVL